MNKPNISVQQGFAQRHRRSVLAVAVLIILSVVLACLVMTCGNTYYSLAEVWNILTSEGTKGAAFTIKTLRLPKMLVGILAGIAFGMSGNTFQTLLRNPLASPDIIGVTSGASAAAVFCILMLKWSGGIVSLVAVLAGLFVAALIYLLARDRHGYSGSRMILIGIGMQAKLFGHEISVFQGKYETSILNTKSFSRTVLKRTLKICIVVDGFINGADNLLARVF